MKFPPSVERHSAEHAFCVKFPPSVERHSAEHASCVKFPPSVGRLLAEHASCVKSHDQPATASLAQSLRSWPLGVLAPAQADRHRDGAKLRPASALAHRWAHDNMVLIDPSLWTCQYVASPVVAPPERHLSTPPSEVATTTGLEQLQQHCCRRWQQH